MMTQWADPLLKAFLFPGDLVCDLSGVPKEGDHRQVLRSFINMIVWGAVSIACALWIML